MDNMYSILIQFNTRFPLRAGVQEAAKILFGRIKLYPYQNSSKSMGTNQCGEIRIYDEKAILFPVFLFLKKLEPAERTAF